MSHSAVTVVQVDKVTTAQNGIAGNAVSRADDMLAVEEPLEIRIGYGTEGNRLIKSISVTMCTPGNDFELAAGFLFTEGIISQASDILTLRYAEGGNPDDRVVVVELKPGILFDPQKTERNFYTTSSCGVCGKSSISAIKNNISPSGDTGLQVPASLLTRLPDLLRKRQEVFEHTGGLHASAIFNTEGKLLLCREDVGRHNALDKLIGAAFLNEELPLNRHILLLSGRASFELLQKAAMAGICIIGAVGAPSSLAVETAIELHITLAGFLRDNRFNIYSGPQRIQC